VALPDADDDVSNRMHGLGGSACHHRRHLHARSEPSPSVFEAAIDVDVQTDLKTDDADADAGVRDERDDDSRIPLDVERLLQLPSGRRLVAGVGLEERRLKWNLPKNQRHRYKSCRSGCFSLA